MSNILGLSRVTRIQKFVTWLFVMAPFVGVVLAVWLSWGKGVDYRQLTLLIVFYSVTFVGITVGFHRCITHKAFKTHPWVESLLAICGSAAAEAPIKEWVPWHRIHHKHSDKEGDPHSPHLFGEGMKNLIRGFFHAHVGWLFNPPLEGLKRYIPDLLEKPHLRLISRLSLLWIALGLLLPTVIGGIWCHSWKGAFLSFLWGGLVRIFLVHHMTWSVNSVCHIWGEQPFKTDDHSKNNNWLAIPSFGESFHGWHHVDPSSAIHGVLPGQIDISYWFIWLLEKCRLAWDVHRPSKEKILAAFTPEGFRQYGYAFV
ncbi:MAG: acyl-CoA desaturase [Patescibacteria group bacterium]